MPNFSRFSLNYIKSKTRSGTLHYICRCGFAFGSFSPQTLADLAGGRAGLIGRMGFPPVHAMYDFLASMNESETF